MCCPVGSAFSSESSSSARSTDGYLVDGLPRCKYTRKHDKYEFLEMYQDMSGLLRHQEGMAIQTTRRHKTSCQDVMFLNISKMENWEHPEI